MLALSTLAFCVGAQAAEHYDSGKREYMDRCAVCHGQSGKGDGGMIDILRTAPTDLTTLSRNNGGVFPFEHVYAVIDGRQAVKGHGSRDMPIWGKAYSAETVRAASSSFRTLALAAASGQAASAAAAISASDAGSQASASR